MANCSGSNGCSLEPDQNDHTTNDEVDDRISPMNYSGSTACVTFDNTKGGEMSNEGRRILIAEDNAALASVVRFNLERAGFHVTVACNGRVAWEHVQEEEFDLVVTDQQMPEMTGCEFCEHMRSVDEFRDLPVIMLTAKGMELELPRLKQELGISATFLKPFSPKEIVKAVEDQLEAVSEPVSP